MAFHCITFSSNHCFVPVHCLRNCLTCSMSILTWRPQLKEQATDSISVLEGALQLKKDFYIHTLRTLDLLAADAAANGETESSTAGLRISADELHCQVSGKHSAVLLGFILDFWMQIASNSVFQNNVNTLLWSYSGLICILCFRCIMIWELFFSNKAAQTNQPIRKPGITSDRQRNC